MNKWSLLLFSVLGLLLSTTSELNFADGRVGFCNRSSRPLLSDTRLSIYEPHCTYPTFTEISQLISPKRDIIGYATKNIELKRSSRSDGRGGQFDGKRIFSDERIRVFSRKNFRENHVDQPRSRDNVFLQDKMERNSLERRIDVEEELSEIRANRFRQNDEPVSVNLKERKQERIHRHTFVIRTNIMLNPRDNTDETRLRFIQKNEGKRNMERSNLDISTRQRLFKDTRLTTDLLRNSDRRFKTDDRHRNERHITMRLDSKIGILKNGNIRNYRRLSVRDDSIEQMYERESLTNSRRNTAMDGTMNAYRRSYKEDISEKILERINSKNVQNERFERLDIGSSRPRTTQSERKTSGNPIRNDKRQMNNGFEKRLFEERYSIQRIPRQNSNINRLREIRQARLYNDIILEDAEDYGNIYIERSERVSDQNRNRKIRENNREIRISEEYTSERSTQRNKNTLVEKRAVSSNINSRRSEAIRRSVLERRERENTRYRLDHENKNSFDQRRIKQIISSHEEDMLRGARNTQRKFIRSHLMGQEINNVRPNYDDDRVSHGFLVRDDNNRKLVNRLERERLSLTSKRAPQIRQIRNIHLENLNKIHIRAINIQENRIQENKIFNRRLVSYTHTNEEKRQARTYNKKSEREELRNSLVREGERAVDESRIRQLRDNHKYKLNVERTMEHVLTRNDRNRNNIVERGVLNIKSSIGNNHLDEMIRSAVTVFRRRENDEVRYWSVQENERVSHQRRTRDVRERREDNLSNERFAQRNLSSRNSMNNAILNNNRNNDENNSKVIFARINQREMTNRLERERFFSVNRRSSYLRMIQREHKNRMHNDYRQLMKIQDNTNRLRNERYAKIIEKQESAIRPEFVDQNLKTKRALILLQLREKDVPSLMRLNKRGSEQSNGILRNRREFTSVDEHSRNIRTAEIRGLRNTNERSDIRYIRNKVITRSIETEFLNSDETHYERRTERVIRNIARHRMSINNRVLLEARSENQRDASRQLEYVRYVRSDDDLRNSAHRENKDNIRTSDRDNIRGRNAKDRARDIRASSGLQILKEEFRITKTRRTNEEEREMRSALSKRYLSIEHKNQSDNEIFEIKLQYMFYLLQGLYILGFFTKNSNINQKMTRFSYWFPLFSTLKVH